METTEPSKIILAIDPGTSGGIAWRSVCNGNVKTNCIPMPETEGDFVHFLRNIYQQAQMNTIPVTVYLELVSGYAGEAQPGSRMFNFGRWFWGPMFTVMTLGFRLELVRPAKWQKALSLGNSRGMTKTEWKNKLKAEAQRLVPDQRVTLKTADALLILEYAQRQIGKNNPGRTNPPAESIESQHAVEELE